MRKTYLVTYDIKGSAERYSKLYDELKNFPGWWHYIDGTWLIRTEDNAEKIFAKLNPYLDNDINLLIIEVGSDRQGWLPKSAWEWINSHIKRS